MSTETIGLNDALRIMTKNSTGAIIGKVMKEGGVLMIDGVMTYLTPAPPWVFRCMAVGIGVQTGAWCRKASDEYAAFMEKLQAQNAPAQTEGVASEDRS